jgi:hypothetical protein
MHLHGDGFGTLYTSAASHTGTAIVYRVLVGVPVDLSPTPEIRTQLDERAITVSILVTWPSAGDLASEVIVDASSLGYRDLVVEGLTGWATPGVAWTLEFDGTDNELIYHYVADASADQPATLKDVDLYMRELHGMCCQTLGGTGDILLTTTGASAGSVLSLVLRMVRLGPVGRSHANRSYHLNR